ncbi:hypothetical protein ACIGCM_10805 [Pseudomonas sp. NPDC078700]
MNSFAAIASLIAASAFTGSINADSQRQLDKAQSVATQGQKPSVSSSK